MNIVWHKWHDPLASSVQKDDANEIDEIAPFAEDENDAIDSFISHFMGKSPYNNDKKTGPILITSTGAVPLFENSIPSKIYNFWMGHTDFPITQRVYDILVNFPGVESFQVYSPYRFRIAIGLAFNPTDVKKNILTTLTTIINREEEETESELVDASVKITRLLGTRFWAKAIQPDDTYHLYIGKTREEVEAKLSALENPTDTFIQRSWDGDV